MAVNPHDPRPQARIRTTSGVNATEPRNAYVDQSLTRRNVNNGNVAEAHPPRSGSTTLGDIRNFYANDAQVEIENTAAAIENTNVNPPPNSPNSWPIEDDAAGIPRSRDYYSNEGMHGQDFFNIPDLSKHQLG